MGPQASNADMRYMWLSLRPDLSTLAVSETNRVAVELFYHLSRLQGTSVLNPQPALLHPSRRRKFVMSPTSQSIAPPISQIIAPSIIPGRTTIIGSCMRSTLICIFALIGLMGCRGEKLDTFSPPPRLEDDIPSRLAREVREHNHLISNGDLLTARAQTSPRIEELTFKAEALIEWSLADLQPNLDEIVGSELRWVRREARKEVPVVISPHRVAWIVSRLRANGRDTVYWLYGMTPDYKKKAEEPFVYGLETALNLRGYRLSVNTCTSPGEWHSIWFQKRGAGVVWRGHGWFSQSIESKFPPYVTSRVWTGNCDPAGETKLFSTTWSSILPEGMAFAVTASCGSAGAWTEEQVNSLEDLGDPGELVFQTFTSQLSDRALYSRGYRGYLVTGGYHLDDMSWLAATALPADRSRLAPGLADAGAAKLMRMIITGTASADYSALEDPREIDDPENLIVWRNIVRVLDSVSPLMWIPKLITQLRACEIQEEQMNGDDENNNVDNSDDEPERNGLDPQGAHTEECGGTVGRSNIAAALIYSAKKWMGGYLESLPPNENDLKLLSSQEWTEWWSGESVKARRREMAEIEAVSPEPGWVWAHLSSSLHELTEAFSRTGEPGLRLVPHCWESMLRCSFSGLRPWEIIPNESGELLSTTNAPQNNGGGDPDNGEDHNACGESVIELVLEYNPVSSTLTHNLANVVEEFGDEEILQGCEERELSKPE